MCSTISSLYFVFPIQPIVIGSKSLDLPPLTKQFLISPPASPPVGWEQSDESTPSAPCVDFSLVTALASLQLPGMCTTKVTHIDH